MIKYILAIYILILGLFSACGNDKSKIDYILPEIPVSLGDPFILLYKSTYYAYGTNSENGIEVYSSDDLKYWKRHEMLALHKKDSYADRWFWAPEVFYINDKFYMYYSADEHICVAVADSPEGPFKQIEKKPMLENEKSIDNSLFIDDDGKAYLTFVRFNDGNNIWSAELTDDLIHIKEETMKPCIHVSQTWEEVWPRVNEGNYITKYNGVYYLTYSANSYESQMYGVGFATATDISGPWVKYEGNPILQNPGILKGVGHSANFRDKNGRLRIVFHAHQSNTAIHPRTMHIGDIDFVRENGKDIMRIVPNSILNCILNP